MSTLLEEFDNLISEAPLDFMGTGDIRYAKRVEKDWNEKLKFIRDKIQELEQEYNQLSAEAYNEQINLKIRGE